MQVRMLRALRLLAAAALAGCGPATSTGVPVRVEITHVVRGSPLVMGSDARTLTAAGDVFTVSKLRYYLSNFRLRSTDGSWFTAAQDAASSVGYQLIDAAVPKSGQFDIVGVTPGSYTGIEFLLGVDEARNHAGAQTGALDPLHGLFWTWKTGYIFFQFEGHSPQSTSDGQVLTFHVGGGAAAARTVFLPLAPKPAKVEARVRSVIHLHADIACRTQRGPQCPGAGAGAGAGARRGHSAGQPRARWQRGRRWYAAGTPLFRLHDPSRLRLVAQSFEPLPTGGTPTAKLGEHRLSFKGQQPLDDAPGWALLFDLEGSVDLQVGQLVQIELARAGGAAPAGACQYDADGHGQLWLHSAAEQFRSVLVADCQQVAAELSALTQPRVVIAGASLLSRYAQQVR